MKKVVDEDTESGNPTAFAAATPGTAEKAQRNLGGTFSLNEQWVMIRLNAREMKKSGFWVPSILSWQRFCPVFP